MDTKNCGLKVLFLVILLNPIVSYAGAEQIITSIFSSTETFIFVSLIVGLTVYLGHLRYSRFSLAHGPEILTTLGIMGCFFGIAIALSDFDTNNVQKSVPTLLQGIKTAFWSSLAGVMGALYIRFLHHVKKSPEMVDPSNVKSASLDDVVSTMVALRKGLVGEEEGTMLSQMKLQRQESNDKLSELIREFKHFAEHMVENNQKAIIEALQQVISDFNNKLTEQFGENFKQLNLAVEKLVTWQVQYKQELELIKNAQSQTAEDLKSVSENFKKVVEQAEKFAEISEALHAQLSLMEKEKDAIFHQEKALSEVLSTMKDVTPEFAEKTDRMLKEITQGMSQVHSEISAVVKNFGVQVQASNAEMKSLLAETLATSQKEVGEAMKMQVATLKEGVITLDTAMQKELNDALESLGRQLSSLSNKFVEDYTPLTDRLKEVVNISRVVS